MLLALSGKAGTGKDTAAKHLMQSYACTTARFSRRIKHLAQDLYGIHPDDKSPFARRVMQSIGDGLRQGHSGVWLREFYKVLPDDGLVLVLDCRYPNEAEFIWALGGAVVRLTPLSMDAYYARIAATPRYGYDRDRDRDILTHPSETALDGYTGFQALIASDTVDDMLAQLDALCQQPLASYVNGGRRG